MVLSKHSFEAAKSRFSGESKNLFCYKLFLKFYPHNWKVVLVVRLNQGILARSDALLSASITKNIQQSLSYHVWALILRLIQTDGSSIGHDILQNLVLTHSLRLNTINLPFWVLLRHVIIYHIVKLVHYEKMRLTDFSFLILVSKENSASWSSEMRLIIVSTFVNLLWSIYTGYNTWNTLLVVYWG